MTTPITKEQALIASLEEDLRAVRMGLIACTTHGGTEKAEDGIPRVDRSLDALATLRSFIESHPVPQVQALEDAMVDRAWAALRKACPMLVGSSREGIRAAIDAALHSKEPKGTGEDRP